MENALLNSVLKPTAVTRPTLDNRLDALQAGVPQSRVMLSGSDLEKLLTIVNRSLKVHGRDEFSDWAQGTLPLLLRHETLVCAVNGGRTPGPRIDVFSSVPMPDGQGGAYLRGAGNGLIPDLVRCWRNFDRRPLVYQRAPGAYAGIDKHMAAGLERLPYASLMAHGLSGSDGEPVSFFGLLGLPGPIGAREPCLLDVLVPYLHVAWLRVVLGEQSAAVANGSRGKRRVLTGREIQILRLVQDGKSNSEIGSILDISHLTVKNHVQKILRKLGAQNRTQAVSRSLALKVLT
jgi:transcriptional regulator EpsA